MVISGGSAGPGVGSGDVCHQPLVAGGCAAPHRCHGNTAGVWSSNVERDAPTERIW